MIGQFVKNCQKFGFRSMCLFGTVYLLLTRKWKAFPRIFCYLEEWKNIHRNLSTITYLRVIVLFQNLPTDIHNELFWLKIEQLKFKMFINSIEVFPIFVSRYLPASVTSSHRHSCSMPNQRQVFHRLTNLWFSRPTHCGVAKATMNCIRPAKYATTANVELTDRYIAQ